ncbi:unnamed protein product [Oreochromis niloticus]|nr:unnamed protein product [Mustela putorius furo]
MGNYFTSSDTSQGKDERSSETNSNNGTILETLTPTPPHTAGLISSPTMKERTPAKESQNKMESSSQAELNEDELTEMETFYKQKLDEMSSALNKKDEDLTSVKHRFTEMETFYKEKNKEMSSALKKKDEAVKSLKHRLTEMETFYKQKLDEMSSALNKKDEDLTSVKHRLTELETFHKEKNNEMRLTSEVVVSEKMGDTENMNNPVSTTKLIEMYQKMKLLQWPKIKQHLKANGMTPELTKTVIQKVFKDATTEMERKKKQVDEVVALIEPSSGPTPQKVKQYRQLATHNYQILLHNSDKEVLLKTPLLEHEAQYSQDLMMKLRPFASECYWLGCLLALNNPPLHLDWQNHIPGMDSWDIFPQVIKGYSGM